MSAMPDQNQIATSGQRKALRDLRNAIQFGATVMGSGSSTVAGIVLTANSRIYVTRNTPGGTLGNLSVPDAQRNIGAGSFRIDSDSGTESSTLDWFIIG